jgi:hypothetical protein
MEYWSDAACILHSTNKMKKYSLPRCLKISAKWIRTFGYSIIKTEPLLISYPKAGRRWVMNVVFNYLKIYNDGNTTVNEYTSKPDIKSVCNNLSISPIGFSHDVFAYKKPIHNWPFMTLANFHRGEMVLLVRDPRDQLASYYFGDSKEKFRIQYSMSEFLATWSMGLRGLIAFTNIWADAAISRPKQIRIVRYENLLGGWAENNAEWKSLIRQLTNIPLNAHALKIAVTAFQINSIKNKMKTLNGVNFTGIRKGKSKSYIEDLTKTEISFIENSMRKYLNTPAKSIISNYFSFND